MPLSVVLIKPEHDIWNAGEHNGTFRGHNLAFVTANEGLSFWRDNKFEESINIKSKQFEKMLNNIVNTANNLVILKGKGMIRGLRFQDAHLARQVATMCFNKGVILETAGAKDEVIKLLPSLNIENKYLEQGISILEENIRSLT